MNELRETAPTKPAGTPANSISYASVAQSLAHDYSYVFCINLETGDFVKYVHYGNQRELVVGDKGTGIFEFFADGFAKRIHPDDRDTALAAITRENLSHVLSVDRSFILTFRVETGGKHTYFEIKATRMIDDPQSIVVGVTDVDAHMQRVKEYERAQHDSRTFASILEAMASDYLNIYYVDTDTGDYSHYNPRRNSRGEGISEGGTNFFSDRWEELLSSVHEEDRDAVARMFSKDELIKSLEGHRTFVIVCRLILRGKVKFVSIKATRIEGETHHVVIGISDIDDQVRREEAHAKALGAAQAIVNRDSLTGVKSKHAFIEAETAYDQMIRDGVVDEFAVVVCDVNGLKAVNDAQGHKAGDELICEACALLCGYFKHSPVYRVGGDEFVAILSGSDYEARANLLRDINGKIDENNQRGGVVVAIGSSDFNPLNDRGFLPVFERADFAMYMRKTELKSM